MTAIVSQCRRKPTVLTCSAPIDADNAQVLADWCGGRVVRTGHVHRAEGRLGAKVEPGSTAIDFPTLHGRTTANMGDRIIQSGAGDFSACTASQFEHLYEEITT